MFIESNVFNSFLIKNRKKAKKMLHLDAKSKLNFAILQDK